MLLKKKVVKTRPIPIRHQRTRSVAPPGRVEPAQRATSCGPRRSRGRAKWPRPRGAPAGATSGPFQGAVRLRTRTPRGPGRMPPLQGWTDRSDSSSSHGYAVGYTTSPAARAERIASADGLRGPRDMEIIVGLGSGGAKQAAEKPVCPVVPRSRRRGGISHCFRTRTEPEPDSSLRSE
jgi:hypothetical protein